MTNLKILERQKEMIEAEIRRSESGYCYCTAAERNALRSKLRRKEIEIRQEKQKIIREQKNQFNSKTKEKNNTNNSKIPFELESVKIARKYGVDESRIMHNADELLAWFRG